MTKRLIPFFLVVFLASSFFLTVPYVFASPMPFKVNVTADKVYVLRGDTFNITVTSNSSSVTVEIWTPSNTLYWSWSQTSNTSRSVTVLANAPYGTYTIKGLVPDATAQTWISVLDVDVAGWQPASFPYMRSHLNVNYTFYANGTIQAQQASSVLTVDLSTLRSLQGTWTATYNSMNFRVRFTRPSVTVDLTFAFVWTGCKLIVNGTLDQARTFTFELANPQRLRSMVDSVKSGSLIFDFGDLRKAKQAFSYADGVLSVDIPQSFTLDPTIFSDGFESNDFSAYSGTEVSNGCSLTTESNNPDHGTYNAKSVVTQYNQADCYKSGLTSSAVMYHYTKYKFGTLPANNNEFYMISGLGSTDYTNGMFVLVRKSGGSVYWGLSNFISGVETRYYEASASNPTTGTYYAVKAMRDVTNGAITLWVDGAQKLTQTGLSLSGNNNIIWSGIGYSECAATQTVYFDCDVADSNDITSDPFAGGIAYGFSLSESITLSATSATQKALTKTQILIIEATSAESTVKSVYRTQTETVVFTATTFTQKNMHVTSTATVSLSSLLTTAKSVTVNLIEVLSETLSVTDILETVKTVRLTLAELLETLIPMSHLDYVLNVASSADELMVVGIFLGAIIGGCVVVLLVRNRQNTE